MATDKRLLLSARAYFASATTTMVGIGLIGANFHFLSDVIAGRFVGISSGWMLTSLWKAHEHFRSRNPEC